MTNKEIFKEIVNYVFTESVEIKARFNDEELKQALAYWTTFKNMGGQSQELTEKGAAIIGWMLQNIDKPVSSKTIGEGLFISPRSVSNTMRKLVADGFVIKSGKDPYFYELSDKGKTVAY